MQIEDCATGQSLVQRSRTEGSVSVIEKPHRGSLGPLGLLSLEIKKKKKTKTNEHITRE